MRGTPVVIAAELIPGKSPVDSAALHVKLTEIQKPVTYPMKDEGERNWQTTLPAELLMPVDHFWYYIEAKDAHGVTDTPWQPVRILESSAGEHQASFSHRAGRWAAGVALLLGAWAIIDHNSGSSDGSAPDLGAPTGGGPSGSGEDEDEDDCEETGRETVDYSKLSPTGDFGSDPIEVVVCGACPDATISARTTWGADAEIRRYNNPGCVIGDDSLTLFIEKPEKTPDVPNSETISIYENGHRIDTRPWPPGNID
ncbi:MAG: hypothetical protein V1873_01250 [Verrucomicrobiota bacterium]